MLDDREFYRRWIAANGAAEAGGLGTTFVAGQALAPMLEQAQGVAAVLAGAFAAVALGTLLEGVVVGWAQARVLRRRSVPLAPGAWVAATALGAGMAWTLGMIPSTIMSLAMVDATTSGPSWEPAPLLLYSLAALLGAATGPILGVAQWFVLRRAVMRAGRWLWANAVAWAIGMPLIFAGMDAVPWTGPAPARILAMYAVCAGVGAAVGAVHGRVLVGLLRRRKPGAIP